MVSTDTQAFPFLKLPPELRKLVYHHVLVFPKPIHPVQKSTVSFLTDHMRACASTDHEKGSCCAFKLGYIYCQATPNVTGEFQLIPDTVLSILATCKQIFEEAVQVFYKDNHIVLGGLTKTAIFLSGIGKRHLHLRELSFNFTTDEAETVYSVLASNRSLKKLHVYMDFPSTEVLKSGKCSLVPARHQRSPHNRRGLEHMLNIKGLEVVELGGFDIVNGGQLVDINDSDAIGPFIKETMTAPYQEKESKVKAKASVNSEKMKKDGGK